MVWKKLRKAVKSGVSSVRERVSSKKGPSKETKSKKRKTVKAKTTVDSKYPNRFLKFYHNNRERLLKERKMLYHEKLEAGICVRCNNQAVEGIKFCSYHQAKQKEYNKKARAKIKRRNS